MQKKYYKAVRVHKSRLFSSNCSGSEIQTIINKRARNKHFTAIEYHRKSWTRKPKIGHRKFDLKLFVSLHALDAVIMTGEGTFAIFECKVKNPTPVVTNGKEWEWAVLADAVKLGRCVKRITRIRA